MHRRRAEHRLVQPGRAVARAPVGRVAAIGVGRAAHRLARQKTDFQQPQQPMMQQPQQGNPFDQSTPPPQQQQPQQQPPQQQEKSDGVAGWIKDMFGSN